MENNTSLQQQLLEAGVHFGHLKKKWNPKMLPYIFAEKKGIHIIDLNKTVEGLEEAAAAMKSIAKSGKKIMFVAFRNLIVEDFERYADVQHRHIQTTFCTFYGPAYFSATSL